MIAQLTGTLLESTPASVVVDVQGVGYEVLTPLSTQEKLPPPMGKVTLHTSLVVREDAVTLYGFLTRREKRLFETIIGSVKGFGPRMALAVLSAMPLEALFQAIAQEDLKTLSRINGVGKKSAAQLVLDMKGRLEEFGGVSSSPAPGTAAASSPGALPPQAQDAVKALETLGFRHEDARRAVEALLAESPDGEQLSSSSLIRRALARFRS
ncbi:MAG: Holliday junction branch migration protein RuvA [Oligosphaeraceae bacterium]